MYFMWLIYRKNSNNLFNAKKGGNICGSNYNNLYKKNNNYSAGSVGNRGRGGNSEYEFEEYML